MLPRFISTFSVLFEEMWRNPKMNTMFYFLLDETEKKNGDIVRSLNIR